MMKPVNWAANNAHCIKVSSPYTAPVWYVMIMSAVTGRRVASFAVRFVVTRYCWAIPALVLAMYWDLLKKLVSTPWFGGTF